jgi:nucleotide-binding universal stress UspA family protein
MPTRGEGPFRRLLAGSVTLKVLHDADCAVWTTAHAETLPLLPPLQIRKILCAIDFRPESARLVSTAAKLASVYGASVCLAHIIPTAKEALRQESIRQLNLLVEEATSRIADEGTGTGLSFETRVVVGQIAHSIRELALQLPADLVVAGHGRAQNQFGEFWSHLGSVIHDSPCSVLSVLGENA